MFIAELHFMKKYKNLAEVQASARKAKRGLDVVGSKRSKVLFIQRPR